jgi:hypothetical protein
LHRWNQIYGFLAERKTTARSPQDVIVGESITNSLSFDLQTFPEVYLPVIQKVEKCLRLYDLEKVLNTNISPLSFSEELLGCGHCNDLHYQKLQECEDCGYEMIARFEALFQRYEGMMTIIPEDVRSQFPYKYLCDYADKAAEKFRQGNHWDQNCRGYKHWEEYLTRVERSFELVSETRLTQEDAEVLLRFFQLPFWKERNRLYEVWTLIHFLHLLRGVSIELNIKDDRWHLTYADSRDPIAWIRGERFAIEIWYQHKLKANLSTFEGAAVEPEMLFIYEGAEGKKEPMVLIECKERKDYDVREIYKLSTFYRSQVGAALNLFCNYYKYSPEAGVKVSSDTPIIILCDQFRPNGASLPEVESRFIEHINNKIGVFLQALLIDVSGSMQGRSIGYVYKELNTRLSALPGSKTLSATFADSVAFFSPDDLDQAVHQSLAVGGGTDFRTAICELERKLMNDNPESAIINFFVITDLDFSPKDWEWLQIAEKDNSLNLTLVTQKNWLNQESIAGLQNFKNVRLMML